MSVENKTEGNSVGVCNQRSLSKAADNCPCTQHTYAEKTILMSPKSFCSCFTFDTTKAEAYVTNQGHSESDEWIFDLGWWLGTDS